MPPRPNTIGEVAAATGLTIDAIRFYEKQGLLQLNRTAAGYRVFGPEQIRTLIFIRNAQQLGFSLAEIRELLVLQDDRLQGCTHVQELLEHKLAAVRSKLEQLRALERALASALRKCKSGLVSCPPHRVQRCPVLEELNRTVPPRSLTHD